MEVKWCERHYKVGVHNVKTNGYVLTGNAKANPVLSENSLYLIEWATYRENNDYAIKIMKAQGKTRRNNKLSKPIIEYDLDMNFIAEYPSVREAERQLGYKSISACLVGKQKTIHGHIFKYKQL